MTKAKLTELLTILIIMSFNSLLISQSKGTLRGGLETNFNYFLRDSLIGAAGLPQYDYLKYGADAWLNLKYDIDTWEIGARFDVFNNSILKNPNNVYTDQGIGNWFIKKQIDRLEITGGHIYDQIGSGAIYRSYEQRALFIDNSLLGLRLMYDITPDIKAKIFTGKQKYLFETYPAIIRGASVEGFFTLGKEKVLTIAPGIGFVNRVQDKTTIDNILNTVKFYLPIDQVVPTYNTYLGTLYSTFSYDAFTLYGEGSLKTSEVFYDPYAKKQEVTGETSNGKYIKKPGKIIYTTLSYAKNKLGITAEYKRTENFDFRVDPSLKLNDGIINFIPPMDRLNTYTLTARYSPATQLLSEQAYQLDLKYAVSKKFSINVNYSNIEKLDHQKLFNEIFTELDYDINHDLKLKGGLQYILYNQPVYEGEGNENLIAYTPFIDILYRLNRKQSLNFETQYMVTDQDYGQWFNVLLEYTIAPKWSFDISGMYNVKTTDRAPKDKEGNKLNIFYPSVGCTYTLGANRFSLFYVKQVEGVVCSGGVCRLEPAFSGVRFNITSRF